MQRCAGKGFLGLWFPLWNIEGKIEELALHSTVSGNTLQRLGYFVPNPTGYKAGQIFAPES